MHIQDFALEFRRHGWSDTAAAELADIHQRLLREGRLDPTPAAGPFFHATGARNAPRQPPHETEQPEQPATGRGGLGPLRHWRRLLALAIVTAILFATAGCGGGGSEDVAAAGVDITTPRVDCAADPIVCR